MNRRTYLWILLPILTLCSSCFEIVEQIRLQENGKGTYRLIGNFSQSKGTIQSLIQKDSVFGQKIPSTQDIDAEIAKVKSKFESMQGISNVEVKKDYNNFIFNMSCEFSSVKALDLALANTVSAFSKGERGLEAGNYFFSGKTFKRQVSYDYTGEVASNMNSQLQAVMEKATFMSIYQFPTTIKSVSNSRANISPNRKATMLKLSLLEISKSKNAIANTIVLD